MSAIWGYLSYTNTIPTELPTLMEAPYRAKCKIDRYDRKQSEHLYFGCGIQYITKEAQTEVLPVFDEQNGIFFTSDCILDNRDELISLLGADSSEPDGSLMYLAYKKWGIDCLVHFRGLFSMAVYDKKSEMLYLATDQAATRCLYYHKTEDFVCFSTLLEPIRKVHPDLSLNELYLKDYLTAPGLMPNIVPTETPFSGVYKINPGCYVTITRDRIIEHSYWSPFTAKRKPQLTAKAYGKEFRSLYTSCVNDALRTAGEVGISMSSGLDSASVGALAATLLRKRDKTLYSYTYVPYETPEPDNNKRNVHDETQDVLKIADMHPNMKTHFLNNQGKNCLGFISQGLDIMEIPFKALVNLPNLYEVYEHAANDTCRVVLTGQVGNSTVSHGYIDDVLYNEYEKKHYLRFLHYLNRFCKVRKKSRKQTLSNCLRYYKQTKEKYHTKAPLSLTPDNPFLCGNILENYPFRERYRAGGFTVSERLPMPQREHVAFLYQKAILTYLGELDTKMGLTTGILLRDPTRDSRMLHFCANLPYHLFAYKGTPRWLIRENLTDLLPKEFLDDWTRYGVQNSDWVLRIIRDRGIIEASLNSFFSSLDEEKADHNLLSLVDIQHAQQYINSFIEAPTTSDTSNLYFFYILLIYIQYVKTK